jgi:glycosyltransferase involved in cell wall biosynthesis
VNILFTIRYFYPFIGGTEKQAMTLARQLVGKGVGVTIVTSRFEKKWPRQEDIDGVKVVRLFSPRIKVAGALLFLGCLAKYLVKNKTDYALIQTFQIGYTATLSILMGTVLKKPSVLKLASSGRGGDIQRARRSIWGRIFLYMATNSSRIIMVSKTVEKELLSENVSPEKLCPISNGVNLNGYQSSQTRQHARALLKIPDKKTVIYTGRLSTEKGIDFLVRSFSRVNQSLDCQLIIIADGPQKKKIEEVIDSSDLPGRVLIIPAVEDVTPFLMAADVFILPSQFEGLSNALLEAMACSLPVISTRVGGSIDIIDEGINGVLVEYNNVDQLSQAISRVLSDPELAVKLGENARKTIERQHDMNTIAQEYLGVYNCLIPKQSKKLNPSDHLPPHRGEGKQEEV